MTTNQPNSALIDRVKTDIANLRQGSLKVHLYYDALKELWRELSALQAQDTENNERVYQFLMGLNDSYANTREKILATDQRPWVESVYSIIASEETDRFMKICKKNAAECMGERRRNPYATTDSVSSRGRYQDYEYGSRYMGLFAPSYGSGGL